MSWTVELVGNGNPTMWAAAAVAMALRWPVASPLVLLKPTLAPFALIGVGSRWWWAGAAAVMLASLAVLSLWPDWVRVMANARTVYPSLLYSASSLPLLAIPVAAMLTATRTGADAPSGQHSPPMSPVVASDPDMAGIG